MQLSLRGAGALVVLMLLGELAGLGNRAERLRSVTDRRGSSCWRQASSSQLETIGRGDLLGLLMADIGRSVLSIRVCARQALLSLISTQRRARSGTDGGHSSAAGPSGNWCCGPIATFGQLAIASSNPSQRSPAAHHRRWVAWPCQLPRAVAEEWLQRCTGTALGSAACCGKP